MQQINCHVDFAILDINARFSTVFLLIKVDFTEEIAFIHKQTDSWIFPNTHIDDCYIEYDLLISVNKSILYAKDKELIKEYFGSCK